MTAPSRVAAASPRSTGADHDHVIGTELERRGQRRAPAGGPVDVPTCGFGGLVDVHGGEQDRDRRRGHQVVDVEPSGDEAPVGLGRRARYRRAGRGEHDDPAGADGGRHDARRLEESVLDIAVQHLPVDGLPERLGEWLAPEQPAQTEARQSECLRGVPRDHLRHLPPQRAHHVGLGGLAEHGLEMGDLVVRFEGGGGGQCRGDQRPRAGADQHSGPVTTFGESRKQDLQGTDLVRRPGATRVEHQRHLAHVTTPSSRSL
jgi:hypothetical protein